MFSWFHRRPSDSAATGDHDAVLARNVWHFRHVPAEWRERHGEVVRRMVGERRWEGAGGLAVTDEMRVTVAGVAALMTLGYDEPYAYPDLPSILLYPGAFRSQRASGGGWLDLLGGSAGSPDEGRLGEAWRRGPIVLSWPDVLSSARRPGSGHNLVLHEFAHYVDALNGDTDGVPSLSGSAARRWPPVMEREFDRLVAQSRRGEPTLLDHYGATNHAEFFAVATECFFERPHEMRQRHGQLFGLFAEFYQQDPAEWLPRPAPRRRQATRRAAVTRVDVSGLGLSGADAAFAEGHELLSAGAFRQALAAFDKSLNSDPDDAEALTLRAEAHLGLGDHTAARNDALNAVRLEPDNATARVAAAEALFELGEGIAAWEHAERARRLDSKDGEAWFYCGLIALHLGRLKEARRSLKRATALDPHDGEAPHWLARVCERLGDEPARARYDERAELLMAEAGAAGDEDEEEERP